MSTVAAQQDECANCGAPLAGPYCAQCGQKVTPLNPPLRDVLHEVAHEVLSFDNRLFRSARLLLTKPGLLTLEYLSGRRAQYVSPLKLYLTFSVLYFAVAAYSPNTTLLITVRPTDPQEAATPASQQELAALRQAGGRALVEWVPRVMFVLVPVFAALIWLVTRRSGRHYPQHLYFALHVHAAWFAAEALAAGVAAVNVPAVTAVLGRLGGFYLFAYLVLALRRAYQLSTPRALLWTLVVGLAYALMVSVAFLAIVLPAIGAFGR
jgi:hypothetical protein